MLLDDLLSQYDFREVHAITVHAPPGRIYRAIREVGPSEVRLLRTLFAIRSLPARLGGRNGWKLTGARPLLEQALGAGFVLLGQVPDGELVLGRIGQFWKLRGGHSPHVTTALDFVAFREPGYAKAAFNFYLSECRAGGEIALRTETRIRVPDAASRRKFGGYWRVIRPGSVLIRRNWLRAIKRRAEGE